MQELSELIKQEETKGIQINKLKENLHRLIQEVLKEENKKTQEIYAIMNLPKKLLQKKISLKTLVRITRNLIPKRTLEMNNLLEKIDDLRVEMGKMENILSQAEVTREMMDKISKEWKEMNKNLKTLKVELMNEPMKRLKSLETFHHEINLLSQNLKLSQEQENISKELALYYNPNLQMALFKELWKLYAVRKENKILEKVEVDLKIKQHKIITQILDLMDEKQEVLLEMKDKVESLNLQEDFNSLIGTIYSQMENNSEERENLLQSQERFQLPRMIEDHIETTMEETNEEIMRQIEMIYNNQANFQALKLSKQANKVAKQISQVKMNLPTSFQILKTLATYLAMKQSKENLIKQIFHKNLEEQMILFLIQIHQNLKMQIMTIEQNEQIGRKWEELTNKSNKIWSLIYLLMIESKLYTNKILINKKSCKMHKAEELENLKQKIETMDQENLKLIVDSYKNREAIDLEYLLNTNF